MYINNNQLPQSTVVRTTNVSTTPSQSYVQRPVYAQSQLPVNQTVVSRVQQPPVYRASQTSVVRQPAYASNATISNNSGASALNRGAYGGSSVYTPENLQANYDRVERDGKIVYVPKNR